VPGQGPSPRRRLRLVRDPGNTGRRRLTARAPPHGPWQLATQPCPPDRRAAATARPAGPAIHPEPVARCFAGAIGGRPGAPAASVEEQRSARRRDDAPQCQVVQGGHDGEGVNPLDEQDLAPVDVADAGHGALVQQRFADGRCTAARLAQPLQRGRGIEAVGEEVGSEARQDGMQVRDRVSKSSTIGASKQTATAPSTSRTRAARAAGRSHRSPGR